MMTAHENVLVTMEREKTARMNAERRLEALRGLVTTDSETKDQLVSRIRQILYGNVDNLPK